MTACPGGSLSAEHMSQWITLPKFSPIFLSAFSTSKLRDGESPSRKRQSLMSPTSAWREATGCGNPNLSKCRTNFSNTIRWLRTSPKDLLEYRHGENAGKPWAISTSSRSQSCNGLPGNDEYPISVGRRRPAVAAKVL